MKAQKSIEPLEQNLAETIAQSVSVHIPANNAHHASAHGGLSANVLSDVCVFLK